MQQQDDRDEAQPKIAGAPIPVSMELDPVATGIGPVEDQGDDASGRPSDE